MPILTYREVTLMVSLWENYLRSVQKPERYYHGLRADGLGTQNFSTLMELGFVVYVDLVDARTKTARANRIEELRVFAKESIEKREFYAACSALEDAANIELTEFVYQLTPEGIAHMESQTDAVTDAFMA